MTNAADSLLAGPSHNLRELLVACNAYRRFMLNGFGDGPFGDDDFGLPDAYTNARTRTYWPAAPEPPAGQKLPDQRPYSIIGPVPPFEITSQGITAVLEKATVVWSIEANVPEALTGDANTEAAEKAFLIAVGDIITEMCALAQTQGYLAISRITLQEGPCRTDPKDFHAWGDCYQATFQVEIGLTQ